MAVALSQVGNVGGGSYWSWYGFDAGRNGAPTLSPGAPTSVATLTPGSFPSLPGAVRAPTGSRIGDNGRGGTTEWVPGMAISFG